MFAQSNNKRDKNVDDVFQFLCGINRSKYIKVYGCYRVGKTDIIERAFAKYKESRNSQINPTYSLQFRSYQPLSLSSLMDALYEKLRAENMSIHITRSALSSKKIAWINRALDTLGLHHSIILIWYCAESTDPSHDSLEKIFTEHRPMRKMILEHRRDLYIRWDASLLENEISASALDDESIKNLVDSKVFVSAQDKDIATWKAALVDALHELCGRHAGLLDFVCNKIAMTDSVKLKERAKDGTLIQLLEELLDRYPESCKGEIESILDSLSPEACKKLKKSEHHEELDANGLSFTSGENIRLPVRLLQNFCRKYPEYFSKRRGKLDMALEEVPVKFVFTKAAEASWKFLKKLSNEVFPPTPLYIAALQVAEKEVRRFIKEKEHGNDLPQLDIKAALRTFDIVNLDRMKVEDFSEFLTKNVKNALLGYLVDDPSRADEDLKAFIDKIINTAEVNFWNAITFANEHTASLWKQYVIAASKWHSNNQVEVLQKVAGLKKEIEIVLIKNNIGGVSAVNEILSNASENSSKPFEHDELRLQRLRDSYDDAWGEWRMARKKIETYEIDLRNLELEKPQVGLTPAKEQKRKAIEQKLSQQREEYDRAFDALLLLTNQLQSP